MSTFPGDWTYKRQLTIDAGQKSGSPSKIVLVITEDALGDENGPLDADGTAPCQNGGGDLRASSDEDGTTQIPLYVAKCVTDNDHTAGKIILHVNFDDLGSDSFWLHWGTSETDSQPAVGDTYGQYAVFDTSEMAYYPLDTDPTGTNNNEADGTANVVSYGSMTSGDLVAGKVGDAIDFDGSNDFLWTSHSVAGLSAVTIEAWVYPHSANQTGVIIGADGGTGPYDFRFELNTGYIYARIASAAGPITTLDGAKAAANSWSHVVITSDGSNQRRYYNGSATGTVDSGSHGTTSTLGENPFIGFNNNNTNNDGSNGFGQYTKWDGLMQHISYHSRALSADDITTKYNSYNDNASFWSVGAVQGAGGGGGGSMSNSNRLHCTGQNQILWGTV